MKSRKKFDDIYPLAKDKNKIKTNIFLETDNYGGPLLPVKSIFFLINSLFFACLLC